MIDSSSSSSAKSSFRELDDVFLQTQTRVWLGEVLNTRLDEDLPISDLLQDGEILFEVSKVVWNLLTTKSMELRHLRHKVGPYGSKKSSGRYRPYSNVDSFLKICKILGLSGIDLFSPSDVVEKRNTRKVCICIRALSKKARSKQLSVPDFDVVMYSVPMSTDMVGVIRRSLESSQCSVSTSSSRTSRRLSPKKLKKWDASAERDDDSSSNESDEAESRYRGENSVSPVGKFDYGYRINSNTENSIEAHSTSRKKLYSSDEERYSRGDATPYTSNINFALERDRSVVGDSSCVSTGENEYISNYLAFSDLMVHANNGDSPVILDGDKHLFDFFLNVDSQESGKESFRNGSRRKFSDDEEMEVASTTSMTSVLGRLLSLEFDEDELLSTNLYSSESKEHEAEKHDGDALVLSERRKIDVFGNQLDSVLRDSQEAHSKLAQGALHASSELFPPSHERCVLSGLLSPKSESQGLQTSNLDESFCPENRYVATDENREPICGEDKGSETVAATASGSGAENLQWDNLIANTGIHIPAMNSNNNKELVERERSSEQLHHINGERNVRNQDTPPVVSRGTSIQNSLVQENVSGSVSFNDSSLPINGGNETQKDDNASYGNKDNNASNAENVCQDNREHLLHTEEENFSDRKKHTGSERPPLKRGIRPLLETAAKGTAVAGVLFLLLQIRKFRGNNAQAARQQARGSKHNESMSSSSRRRTGGDQPMGGVRKGLNEKQNQICSSPSSHPLDLLVSSFMLVSSLCSCLEIWSSLRSARLVPRISSSPLDAQAPPCHPNQPPLLVCLGDARRSSSVQVTPAAAARVATQVCLTANAKSRR